MKSADQEPLPLAGIRVLEFTHAVMGPACGMVLADLGAEVIHVEPPTGDPTRRLPGFGAGFFPFYGRNKKSLAIDIKHQHGRKIVLKLIDRTDVVVENFGPGTMDRLGYGFAQLSTKSPRLIYCSLKGFLSGPYKDRQALDEVVQMMAGLAYMTGPPGRPLRAGASVVDVGGALFAVIAILLALRERDETGQGQFLRSGLFETAAFFMGQHMACAALSDHPLPPMSAGGSTWSVYQTFQTRTGEAVFIGLTSDRHWHQFCRAFGQIDWLEDPRLETNNDRVQAREWMIPNIQSLISTLPQSEVLNLCQQAGIPFAPVARPEDLFEDPQLNGGNGLLETVLPNGARTKMPRLPFEMKPADFGLRLNPPKAGEHTTEILTSLGYTGRQIRTMAAAGTIAGIEPVAG